MATPVAMRIAGKELGKRRFFTQMIRIADLIRAPAISDALASQYSEGCFATWDPELHALIATVTGSARPVDKTNVHEDDLAAIVGVRENGEGALVREVDGKLNQPPSSEAVEMRGMDDLLPWIQIEDGPHNGVRVPVVRSKLHGHRGVAAYDPCFVEYTPLEKPYFHYPVSCATAAQAQGIMSAFSNSAAFQNPLDPRQLVFTILPGHGVVIAEKWQSDKEPLQNVWEYMDQGRLQIDNLIAQGPMGFRPGADGRMWCHDQQ